MWVEERKMEFPSFSVAMCVYGKDEPEWFDAALRSVIDQTVPPGEIIVVADGPISDELQAVIDAAKRICEETEICFVPVYLEQNQGHGIARRCSLEHCTNELVALMDADDLSLPNRFEQQLALLEATGADLVGGDISEFIDRPECPVGKRCVPVQDDAIKAYMKDRCPMNQVSVMFRRSSVQTAGGYLDWYCNEDYYLWLRMYLNGCRFANTGTVLVNVRVGREMYQRRGGWKYFRSEAKLQRFMLKKKIILFPTYLSNVARRLILQVLLPNKLRGWVFRKFARS